MKGLGLFCIMLMCSLLLPAQDSEQVLLKSNFVGLSASFSTVSNDNTLNQVGSILVVSDPDADVSTTSYAIRPTIGRYINDHIVVGLDLSYVYTKLRTESLIMSQTFPITTPIISRNDRIDKRYGAGVFMRYILNPENKLQANIQPSLNYLKSNESFTGRFSDTFIVSEDNSNAIFASINFGVTYNISDRFRFITRIGGLNYETGNRDNVTTTTRLMDVFNTSMPPSETTIDSKDFSSFTTDFTISSLRFGAEYLF